MEKQTLLKKSVATFSLKLLASGLGLAFSYVLAKQLGAEQFGLFSLALSCLMFSGAFAKQGLEPLVVRFLSACSLSHAIKLYCTVLIYAGLSACLLFILLYYFAEFWAFQVFKQALLIDFMPIIAMLTFVQAFLAINSNVYKSQGYAATSLLFTGVVSLGLSLALFIYCQPNSALVAFKLFAIAASIACVISFLLLFFLHQQLKQSTASKGIDQNNTRPLSRLFKLNASLFVIALCALATQQLSTLILARHVTLVELGQFSLALKASLLMSYPLIAINAITAPQYAKLHQAKQIPALKTLFKNSQQILLAVAALALAFFWLTADLLTFIFGQDFTSSALLLRVLVIGQFFNLATGSVVSLLIMAGYDKLHQRNTLILSGMTVVCLLMVIPYYGVMGAAIVISLAMAIKNLVSWYFAKKMILNVEEVKP